MFVKNNFFFFKLNFLYFILFIHLIFFKFFDIKEIFAKYPEIYKKVGNPSKILNFKKAISFKNSYCKFFSKYILYNNLYILFTKS